MEKNDLDYLKLLFRSEAVITGEPDGSVRYNDFETKGEFKLELLTLEVVTCWDMLPEKDDPQRWRLVQECIMELEDVFLLEKDRPLHRYLQIMREGKEVCYQSLEADSRREINEFILLQRASFLRLRRCFLKLQPVLYSDFTLLLKHIEVAELIAFFYQSGIVDSLGERHTEKEFIYFFCRMWNLPVNRDYYTSISRALARPSPMTLLDRLMKSFENHIDVLNRRRK